MFYLTAKRNVDSAHGHPTAQSSVAYFYSLNELLTASLAVDGNADPNILHGSCMETNGSDGNPWMSVDLGARFIVTGVSITNTINPSCGE